MCVVLIDANVGLSFFQTCNMVINSTFIMSYLHILTMWITMLHELLVCAVIEIVDIYTALYGICCICHADILLLKGCL